MLRKLTLITLSAILCSCQPQLNTAPKDLKALADLVGGDKKIGAKDTSADIKDDFLPTMDRKYYESCDEMEDGSYRYLYAGIYGDQFYTEVSYSTDDQCNNWDIEDNYLWSEYTITKVSQSESDPEVYNFDLSVLGFWDWDGNEVTGVGEIRDFEDEEFITVKISSNLSKLSLPTYDKSGNSHADRRDGILSVLTDPNYVEPVELEYVAESFYQDLEGLSYESCYAGKGSSIKTVVTFGLKIYTYVVEIHKDTTCSSFAEEQSKKEFSITSISKPFGEKALALDNGTNNYFDIAEDFSSLEIGIGGDQYSMSLAKQAAKVDDYVKALTEKTFEGCQATKDGSIYHFVYFNGGIAVEMGSDTYKGSSDCSTGYTTSATLKFKLDEIKPQLGKESLILDGKGYYLDVSGDLGQITLENEFGQYLLTDPATLVKGGGDQLVKDGSLEMQKGMDMYQKGM